MTTGERIAPDLDDAVVIERSLHEAERFARVFDKYAPRIHRYAARRLGDAAADDIVAETFLAAFRQRADYDLARPNALPWLYGIATNKIRRHQRAEVNRYRAYSRTGEVPSEDMADMAVDKVSAQADGRRLASALAALHRRDRDVLLLIAWGDLGYEEVAAVMSIPVGTVRSRLNRARRRIREALGRARAAAGLESDEGESEHG